MKVLLALQVIGKDLSPVQIAVCTDPDLIRAFVEKNREVLHTRVNNLPAELTEVEMERLKVKDILLDTVLEWI